MIRIGSRELGAAAQKYADETVYDLGYSGITSQLAANSVRTSTSKLNAEAAGNLARRRRQCWKTYKQVGLALVQVNGAGKLATQDWNQIANAIPGASGKIRRPSSTLAHIQEFQDAMAQGRISAEFNSVLSGIRFDGAESGFDMSRRTPRAT